MITSHMPGSRGDGDGSRVVSKAAGRADSLRRPGAPGCWGCSARTLRSLDVTLGSQGPALLPPPLPQMTRLILLETVKPSLSFLPTLHLCHLQRFSNVLVPSHPLPHIRSPSSCPGPPLPGLVPKLSSLRIVPGEPPAPAPLWPHQYTLALEFANDEDDLCLLSALIFSPGGMEAI